MQRREASQKPPETFRHLIAVRATDPKKVDTMATQVWLSDRDIAARAGMARVTPWRHAKNGTLTPPVRLSAGCTRWPAEEIAAIERARLTGADDAAVRALVLRLVADRRGGAA